MGKTSRKLWETLSKVVRQTVMCPGGVLGRKDDWSMARLGVHKLTRRSSLESLCKLVLIQNSIKTLIYYHDSSFL